ncbi:hypothetical protein VARIO8X_120156 [Burkholderiales bacterium 8X]|nr:hypothetical protein VARIO8X_120156 [Burkholderiales bacterium 8X]
MRRGARAARRHTDHHQGEHRHPRRPDAFGHRGGRALSGGNRCTAGRTPQGSRHGDRQQDHHARLRHAVLRLVELSRARAQSVGPDPHAGRQQRRRGRRGGRRLRPAAHRYRHRRFASAAGRLVRHLHPQAEPRPHTDRSALHGPGRGADDPHGRRCRADDAGAGPAGPARQHEPARAGDRLERLRGRHRPSARPSHRPPARCGLRSSGRARNPDGGRACGRLVRAGRRDRRADAALHDADPARRHGPPVAHALVRRHAGAAGGPAREGAALHPAVGRKRRLVRRRARVPRLQPVPCDPGRGGAGLQPVRLRDLADGAQLAGTGRDALADQRPAAAAGAHRLHGALQHVGAARVFDQLRLHPRRAADRAADRRAALRRPGRVAGFACLRAVARAAAALAGAAGSSIAQAAG